jgi:RimJ/RimL family protein N-acetyltransferase
MDYSMLMNIPVPIQTRRLLIRPPLPGDGLELNLAVKESQQELEPWVHWASHTPSLEDSELNVRNSYADWILRRDLRLLLFDKKSGRLIGSSGFHNFNWTVKVFEIGYWVRSSHAGQGFISEAVTALTTFAFAEFKAKRIEIRCDGENLKSKAIPIRLGYKLEAVLRDHCIRPVTKAQSDTHVFVRFNGDGLPDIEAQWGEPFLFQAKF